MKFFIATLIAVVVVTPSLAQTAPQKQVSITITPEEITSLMNYLNSLPYGQAVPIVQFLGQHEAAAAKAAEKSTEKK